MPVTTTVADALTKRLPKVVSPEGHAIADYLTIAGFFVAGALFWRLNRRAALAAFACGGTELAVNLLTDYPGGVRRLIGFPLHGKIDLGMAAMAATIPEFMGFAKERQRGFFLAQAGIITATTNLTNFDRPRLAFAKRKPKVA
ncbi:MAG: hypothetical protein ABJA69_11385 [Acidobacteriaceae bacterium]